MKSSRAGRAMCVSIVSIILPAICLASDPPPPQVPENITVLDSGQYDKIDTARAAWQPAERGTPPVEIVNEMPPGINRLRLSSNFKTNNSWRVAWDLLAPKSPDKGPGVWDLSACQSIRLSLSRPDSDDAAAPATPMLLYLHSGQAPSDGWYSAHFVLIGGVIELPRKKFGIEGTPSGWDRIDRIRLCIIRQDEESKVTVHGIAAVARPAHVAIYRNGAGLKAEPGVTEYVRQMGDALDRLSIGYQIVGDEEVAAGKLTANADIKVAILPLNPVLPKDAAAAIEKFVAGGGKLIVCYCLRGPMEKLFGVKSMGSLQGGQGNDKLRSFAFESAGGREKITAIQDSWIANRVTSGEGTKVRAFWADREGKQSTDPAVTSNGNGFFIGHVLTPTDQANKDRLVQAMVGELWPEMWEDIFRARLAGFGRLAGFADAKAIQRAMENNADGRPFPATVQVWLNDSVSMRGGAEEDAKAGKFASAVRGITEAEHSLLKAYAASIAPKAGEIRAVWCHSQTGVAYMTWDEAIKRLADSGFNAIIPNMCWGYSAAYESKLLPRAPGADRDQLAECLAAAKKYGVAVHVWRVNWNLFWHASDKVKAELRAAGRLQQDQAGKPIDWLCPSNPVNQKLELDAMVEIARNYDVAGLHFDYIRYPGMEGCYCPGCRQRFEAGVGSPVKNWPADAVNGPMREKFLQFRRDNITQLVAAVSEQARKAKPGIKISAAVFPDWKSARDDVGQDWKLWVEKGYLDFVCPMQYTDNAAWFEAQTKRNMAMVGGKIPLLPGIGATLGLSPDGTLQQVLAARKQGTAGFVLFNFDRASLDHLDLLKLGATKPGFIAGR